jgi:hypothetical protein
MARIGFSSPFSLSILLDYAKSMDCMPLDDESLNMRGYDGRASHPERVPRIDFAEYPDRLTLPGERNLPAALPRYRRRRIA